MKTLKIFLWILAVLIVIGVVILTPVGKFIFKQFAEYEIEKYFPSTQITYLDYGFNNFSITLRNENNKFTVFGQMLPLNAMYEGELNDIFKILRPYRGAFKINGIISSVLDTLAINGNIVLTGTGGVLQYKILKNNKNNTYVDAKGKDIDTKKLLYMLGLDIKKDVEGKPDLTFLKHINQNFFNFKLKMKGKFKKIYSFNMESDLKYLNRKTFSFVGNVESNIGNINILGEYDNAVWKLNYNAKNINLEKLNLLYPFKGKISLKGTYNSANNILKFSNDKIKGAYTTDAMELGFSLNSKEFFQYLGLKKLFKAYISGTARIMSKSGTFEILAKNVMFYNSDLIDKIYKLTGINLNKSILNKVFIKGIFDKNMVVFDLLSSDKKVSISITKGKYYYNGKYKFTIVIRKNKKVYKI